MLDADDIRWLLRKRYCAPEYAIAMEVGNSTGWATSRHLDAIAMGLYPSRGLPLYGIEIKISRGDLKKEIQTPDKAEKISQFLDYFIVVFPEELKVLDLECPPGWGLMSASQDGLKLIKQPEKIESVPLTKSFVAALFRSMYAEDEFRANLMIKEKVDALTKALENDFNSRVQRARDLQRSENDVKIKWADTVINELQTAGFDWRNLRWHEHDFVLAVKAALTYESIAIDGVEIACQMMENTARELRKQVTEIRGKSSKRDEMELDNPTE